MVYSGARKTLFHKKTEVKNLVSDSLLTHDGTNAKFSTNWDETVPCIALWNIDMEKNIETGKTQSVQAFYSDIINQKYYSDMYIGHINKVYRRAEVGKKN